MIENIVQTVIANRKLQFEEKMNNPRQFIDGALSQTFQTALDSFQRVQDINENNNKINSNTKMDADVQAAKEWERRFGEVTQSASGQDAWKVLNKYDVQSINPKYRDMYIDVIHEMSVKYGVPAQLIQKMIETESHFQPNTVSSAGAMGLMQLMPANVKEHGVTNPYDPRQNIEAGVQEISGYLKQYNGDLVLALAAYNAGPGNVRKYGGVPPFHETEQYIKKILNVDVSA